jgi:hypothetical protein
MTGYCRLPAGGFHDRVRSPLAVVGHSLQPSAGLRGHAVAATGPGWPQRNRTSGHEHAKNSSEPAVRASQQRLLHTTIRTKDEAVTGTDNQDSIRRPARFQGAGSPGVVAARRWLGFASPPSGAMAGDSCAQLPVASVRFFMNSSRDPRIQRIDWSDFGSGSGRWRCHTPVWALVPGPTGL